MKNCNLFITFKYFFSYRLMHSIRGMLLITILLFSNMPLSLQGTDVTTDFLAVPYSGGTIAGVHDCSEFSMISCDSILNLLPSDGDYKGTLVVLDQGFSRNDWFNVEDTSNSNGFYLDIIGYVMPDGDDPDTEPEVYGQAGVDTLDGVTDSDLGYAQETHGLEVLSAVATIARRAKVLFINTGVNGFRLEDVSLWFWLDNNRDDYNIRVITISQFGSIPYQTIYDKIDSLHASGVTIVAAAGNDGLPMRSNLFPQHHQYVYTVGSIDHKNVGEGLDFDYHSRRGYRSGESQDARDHQIECESSHLLPFCSSYGVDVEGDPLALDFLMPGNYVPLSDDFETFFVGFGTSFSAPYLAAAILLVTYAYWLGYYGIRGYGAYNSVSAILNILKDSDRNSSWSQKWGWGYVDLWNAYFDAFDKGLNDGRGGSGGGGCPSCRLL